jgi:prepilin-type N-terminal cleavage/methylation domain-containing protein
MSAQKGFTLVELAIVLMIIGLLIGGILKGQELIQNARITSTMRQFKSSDAATLTFLDSYGALPGDITNPSTRLPNCTTSPCTLAGDGNTIIGPVFDGASSSGSVNEQSVFWIHLASTNLVSNVHSDNWIASTWYSNLVSTPLGGIMAVWYFRYAPDALFTQGIQGNHWRLARPSDGGYSIPIDILGRLDQKMDNGAPYTGDIVLGDTCGLAANATIYDANNKTLCSANVKAQF